MLGFSLRPLFGQQRRPSRSSRAKLQPRLCLEILENRLVPSTLHVGSNKQFHTIQDAVNAAHSNDTIKVAPGTYQEQVVIGSGKDGIRLAGSGQNATIKAPAVLTGAHAVVQVSGAQNVTIQGFTIEGPASTSNSGGNLYGVRIDGGGSATVMHNHITKIHNTPFNGVQEGIAIVVGQASASQTGSAVISHNTIDNYQKGGIVVSNTGSSAAIEHNTIVGAGPTALLAQNGIQISSGATAHVTRNSISGNQYAPQTAAATGILLFSPGAVTIDHNTLSNNDVGIYSIAATALDIDHNKVTASTFIGILLDTTTGARVSDNTTDKAGDAGIALLNSTNNTIDHNESANNDGDGIFVDSASTGNVFDRNRLTGNGNFDAEDLSTGSGTAGTGNTWTKNKGKTSSPPGLVS
jgi:parallel beta-helix repeat protein